MSFGRGWTFETLYSFMQQRFLDMAVAVEKANQASEKRFDSVNEFRNALKDQQQTFVTRGELYAMLGVTASVGAVLGALIAKLIGH
jgi:ElaB/YqjD/DUF883 family membrane-anchored ribosome-binding protein